MYVEEAIKEVTENYLKSGAKNNNYVNIFRYCSFSLKMGRIGNYIELNGHTVEWIQREKFCLKINKCNSKILNSSRHVAIKESN